MPNWRSMKAYTEEGMDSILNRLGETARRLNVTSEELVVRAFSKGSAQIPQETVDCYTIEELEIHWPYIFRPEHICNCVFCQELIKAAFPGLLVEADSDFANEANKVKKHFNGICQSCYSGTIIKFGNQQFFPIPLRRSLSHVRQCLFCQLLIHYHRDEKDDRLGLSCLDMNGWRVYPLFHPDDLHNITEHVIKTCHCVIGDEKCSGRAVLRFRLNALRDRPLFQQLKRQPMSRLKRQVLVSRFVKKPIGDYISWRRFRRNMFTKKHSWSIWKSEDGLLRLLTADVLSYEEHLYQWLLEEPEKEEEIVSRLIATFPDYKPWDWTYKLPDRPLLWNRATIIDFLRLENESHRRGISVEELKALESEEDTKIHEEVEATLRAKGRL